MRETERVARAMVVQLTSLEVERTWPTRPSKAFDQAFEAAMLGQVDALIAVEDYLTFADLSYGTDRRDLFRRCATYVHRILNGARPADLPVEQPTKFELAINLKTARGPGLTIPPFVLLPVDHIIQ